MKKLTITIAIAALIFGCEKTETAFHPEPEYKTKLIFFAGEELSPHLEFKVEHYNQEFQIKRLETKPPSPNQEEIVPYYKVYKNLRPGIHVLKYRYSNFNWQEKYFVLKDDETLILDLSQMHKWIWNIKQ